MAIRDHLKDGKLISKQEMAAGRPKKLKIYLVLAGIMILCSAAAYLFQQQIWEATRRESAFLYALVLPLLAGMFFLYCYQVPKLGYRLLGRQAELGANALQDSAEGAPTYNIFQSESGSDSKIAMSKVKRERQMRRKLAREAGEKQTDKSDYS